MNQEQKDSLDSVLDEYEQDFSLEVYDLDRIIENINLDSSNKTHERTADKIADWVDEARIKLEDHLDQIEEIRRALLRVE